MKKGDRGLERKYNKLTEEQLAFAQKQREEYYLTEDDTVSVRLRRDKVQELKRYFGQFDMTLQEAMAHFALTAFEKGKVAFDENGFREEDGQDA